MKGRIIAVLSVALSCVSLLASAQINSPSIDVAKPNSGKKMQATAPYDSTYNLPSNKARFSYIGQMIFLPYSNNPDKDYYGFSGYDGTRADLMEHYYIVESIEDNTGVMSRFDPYVITFHDKDREGVRIKYAIDFDREIIQKWVTVSYYNYLKSLIGSKYYCLQKKSVYNGVFYTEEWGINDHDMFTGDAIEIERTDAWELVDFRTHNTSKRLIAIFKNERGQTSFADIMDFGLTPLESYYLFPDKEYKRLTKKYGAYYTKMVLEQKYAKGMPKELFKLMMGLPYEINHSSYQDQWVYHKDGDIQCYYFQNGKLTGWN